MRRFLLTCIVGVVFSGCASLPEPAPVDPAWDAVAKAPKSHQVLLENERVRVLRVSIEPGAIEPIHDHRWPSVMYFEQPQPIEYISYELVGGKPVETSRIDATGIPVGHAEMADPEGLHAVQNKGDKPFIAIRGELKNAS